MQAFKNLVCDEPGSSLERIFRGDVNKFLISVLEAAVEGSGGCELAGLKGASQRSAARRDS